MHYFTTVLYYFTPTIILDNRETLLNGAFLYDPSRDYRSLPQLSMGGMTVVCGFCRAIKFNNESVGLCCASGAVELEPMPAVPAELETYMSTNTPANRRTFLDVIRKYNAAFQMSSFGTRIQANGDEPREPGYNLVQGFQSTFRIQGQIYHRTANSIRGADPNSPTFLSIYFTGSDTDAVNRRCQINRSLAESVVRNLQRMLDRDNELIMYFRTAAEKLDSLSSDHRLVIKADSEIQGIHRGRLNAPTSSTDIAVLIVDGETPRRDIVMELRGGGLQKINATHRLYDPLQYPLLFPRGEYGYDLAMRRVS